MTVKLFGHLEFEDDAARDTAVRELKQHFDRITVEDDQAARQARTPDPQPWPAEVPTMHTADTPAAPQEPERPIVISAPIGFEPES